MRKILIQISLLILPLLLFSCRKDAPAQPFLLNAGVEAPSVRSSMGEKNGEGKYPVYWSEGDVIAVNGALSAALTAGEAGGASATFTFDEKPATAGVYNLVCPGNAVSGRVVFPSSQTYTENSFCPGAAPLICVTDDLDAPVVFTSCAAIVRFPMTGSVTLSSMTVTTPGGEKISGNFNMSLVPQDGAFGQMDYSFGGGLTLDGEAKAIIFTVPAGTYRKGLRAVLQASNGSAMTISFFTTGATLAASTVCTFPSLAFQAWKEIIFNETDPMGGEEIDLEEQAGTDGMGAEDASTLTSIKVGSYNIWAPSARKSVMEDTEKYGTVSEQRSWANSYTAVADMINSLDCDVIGIQEVTKMVYQTTLTSGNEDYDGNVHTLNSLLPNYRWVIYNSHNTTYDNLTNNTTANGLGSTDAILYKSSVLTLESKGRAWLNGTRNKAPQDDQSWDGIGSNRPATWAKFTHKSSGKQFVFIVTHLDLPGAGEESDPAYPQRRNAQELITWFAPMVTEDLPSVITGDMNVDAGDAAGNYDILISGRWKDVYDTMKADGSLSYTDRQVKGTMPANKNEEGGLSSWRPDHIFFYGFMPSYYCVCRDKLPTADASLHWPSDHLPVIAVLNF